MFYIIIVQKRKHVHAGNSTVTKKNSKNFLVSKETKQKKKKNYNDVA